MGTDRIVYHYVRPANSDGAIGITPDRFRRHLEHVRRHGAVLTFDDGLRDHIDTVVPILEEFGLRGVFAIPACILHGHWPHQTLLHARLHEFGWQRIEEIVRSVASIELPPDADRLYHYELPERRWLKYVMAFETPPGATQALLELPADIRLADWHGTEDEWVSVAARGHSIANHGYTHWPLTTIPEKYQRAELLAAHGCLSGYGLPPTSLVCPFNQWTDTARQFAEEFDYECLDQRTDAADFDRAVP